MYAAASGSVISVDVSLLINGAIALLLAIVAFFLRTWYVGIEAHMKAADERLDRIERAIARLGGDATSQEPRT